MEENQEKTQRLFLALIPPENIKEQLSEFIENIELDSQYKDKVKFIPPENYHITLQFLGNVETILVPRLIEILNTIKINPFEIILNQVGYFKKSHVLWLGPKNKPEGLDYLVDACFYKIFNNINFEHEIKNNTSHNGSFNPHVTLIKKVNSLKYIENISSLRKNKSLKPNIKWPVTSFYLVKSELSQFVAEYHIMAEFE